jgi:hypothetical protein
MSVSGAGRSWSLKRTKLSEHLREYAFLEARIDQGGLVQEVIIGEVL